MKISVVIPCFNVERYIAECLDSVLNQTFKALEIICVDDCSTDGTLAILDSYSKKNPGIMVLRNDVNQGAPHSRNRGLQIAQGEYVQFLDADDVLLPEKLKVQVDILNKCTAPPAFIVGDYTKVALTGGRKDYVAERNDVWLGLLKTRLGSTCSNLWNRDFLESIGGWSDACKSSQEYELMFRMLKKQAPLVFDASKTTIVRERESGSISKRNYSLSWMAYCDLRESIVGFVVKNRINEPAHHTYYQVLFDSIRTLSLHNPEEAWVRFDRSIPKTFVPERSDVTSGLYLVLFRLFGFRFTEKIKHLFA